MNVKDITSKVRSITTIQRLFIYLTISGIPVVWMLLNLVIELKLLGVSILNESTQIKSIFVLAVLLLLSIFLFFSSKAITSVYEEYQREKVREKTEKFLLQWDSYSESDFLIKVSSNASNLPLFEAVYFSYRGLALVNHSDAFFERVMIVHQNCLKGALKAKDAMKLIPISQYQDKPKTDTGSILALRAGWKYLNAPEKLRVNFSDVVELFQNLGVECNENSIGVLNSAKSGVEKSTAMRATTVTKWPWGDHHTELLGSLEAAAKRFWINIDPDDETTLPKNEEISEWLQNDQRVSENISKAIATILRPKGGKPGPKKK